MMASQPPPSTLTRLELLAEVRAWRAAAAEAGVRTPEGLRLYLRQARALWQEMEVVRDAWEAGARVLAQWRPQE
jgi:hypothetical protein